MPSDAIAAIDLGSNSFHMILTRPNDGQLQVVERMKEMVQLAAGLDKQRLLNDAAQQRALDCLARFGQRLRHLPSSQVRAVGTNTLRQARNGRDFLSAAEAALGHPIEIISGVEEARLIYLGVVNTTAVEDDQRLVVDIGGGSTELIVGRGQEPLRLQSLYMGCVSLSRRFFADKRIREADQKKAELAVRLELEPVAAIFREHVWRTATGASGTIKAVRDVVSQEGWSREGISRESLHQLRAVLHKLGKPAAFAERWQLNAKRAAVFAGGFSVLYGVFEALAIDHMKVSEGALREGVVYDLLGRIRHEDARERTINALIRRYSLDTAQAQRVVDTVNELFGQVRNAWQLEDERFEHDLLWAARLHEIGLALAHSHYHRHGAYVLQHSDLPGFSRSEQMVLAALVRGHRRKFPQETFKALPDKLVQPAERLCILLRLAVLLHRGHRRQDVPPLRLSAAQRKLVLEFPTAWLDEHPLTQADLEREAQYLKKAGYELTFG